MRKSVFIFLLSINFLTSIVLYYQVIKNSRNKYSASKTGNIYGLNNKYLINNNVAQYSSFVIVDQDDDINIAKYRIEAYVNLNYKYVEHFGPKENYICLIKFINGITSTEKIVEIEASESFRNSKEIYYKKVFFLSVEIFNTDLEIFNTEYLLDNIYVAVIWKNDFNKSLDVDSFTNLIDQLRPNKTLAFPYSFIKFQKPNIIKNQQPRSKSVGLCVHYTYKIPTQIFNWIDIQLELGIAEIMFYDAVENNNLTNVLKHKYGNDKRVVVKPYNIHFDDLCHETKLFEQLEHLKLSIKVKKYLNQACFEFFDHQFSKKYEWRLTQEKITSNDCYTVLSQKHELIGYYDIDEIVFPRTLNLVNDFYGKNKYYACKNSSKSICDLNPFYLNISKENKLYNYLHSIIETNRRGKNMTDFVAIYFHHALFLTPNEIETRLVKTLGAIIDEINSGSTVSFPLRLFLSDPITNASHKFIIKNNDIDYIKYLYKSYNMLIPCIYNKNLKYIDSMDDSLVRHFYFITEELERLGKAFCYYKNIVALTPHGAEFDRSKWWVATPTNDGYLSHFRKKLKIKNFTGSILKLNFDSEHVFYLLKKHSKYCEIKIQ